MENKYKDLSEREIREKIEELSKKIDTVKSEYDFYKSMQLGLKLVLNGTYGAFCHQAFTVSNKDIANSITAMARDVITYMLENIEDYFYNKWHEDKEILNLLGVCYIGKGEDEKYYLIRKDGFIVDTWGRDKREDLMKAYNMSDDDMVEKDIEVFNIKDKKYVVTDKMFICDFSKIKALDKTYKVEPVQKSQDFDEYIGVRNEPIIIYGDTDSVDKNSKIKTNTGEYTIEDLYNKNISTGDAGNTLKGHESVKCEEEVLNWSDDKKLYYAPVKRLIKHKVTKDKWKLKTKSGKEIIVTNDHSMIVFRDGIKMEVKPSEILKTDKILIVKDGF